MIQLVEDILEATNRLNMNMGKEFERETKGGLMSLTGFRAVLCKINQRYSQQDNSQTLKIMKLLEPFYDRSKSGAGDAHKYDCQKFIQEVQRVIDLLFTRDGVFDKIYAGMQKGRNKLFEELKIRYDKVSQGMAPLDEFFHLFKDKTQIELSDSEKEALTYCYSMMDQIMCHNLEGDFKKRLSNRGRNFSEIADDKSIGEEKKIIFAYFYDYFARNQILRPVNFFKEFQASPDPSKDTMRKEEVTDPRVEHGWTISRYSFKEAVHQVMPSIKEDQYQRFEIMIEPNAIGRISLTRFQELYFNNAKYITKHDLDSLVGKVQ